MASNDTTAHWYQAITPARPDSNGSSIVGEKWVEIKPGLSLHFAIIRQANGDFVVRCDQAGLRANHLAYRERTIYSQQALAMPSQVIWSIILEGVTPLA